MIHEGHSQPLSFGIESDSYAIAEDGIEQQLTAEEEEEAQLQNLLETLELAIGPSDGILNQISFIDENGEYVFFKTEHILLVEVSLIDINPDLAALYEESLSDEDQDRADESIAVPSNHRIH